MNWAAIVWLILLVLFMLVEAQTVSVVSVWFAVGALTAMIVSLLGQGLAPLTAAACGAWLHGAAGDLCAKKLGQYGMLPSDMVEALPRLLK